MKALLINGSPNEHGCTFTALSEIEKTLQKHGIETEIVYLGKEPLAGCIACGACYRTGKCFRDDIVNQVAAKLESADAVVVGSPVYYASASGQITSFLDRLFFSAGGKMDKKLAAAVVSCRRGGATAAFDQLNKYFAKGNMPIVTSQYWNQVHGNTPEEVMRDKEGLQTMRTLGENMAWLLGCIAAGRAAGVPEPMYEKPMMTNFIR